MSPVLRTLIFTILVPGFWTVAIPFWVLPRGARPDLRGVNAAGWVFIIAGAVLYFACAFWDFAIRGMGTPMPLDPPKKLVIAGPYAIVRNPMYWGVGSVILGEALVFHSRPIADALGIFVVGVVVFVLGVEEPSLHRKFGAEYEEYCGHVPRWFPRFKTK